MIGIYTWELRGPLSSCKEAGSETIRDFPDGLPPVPPSGIVLTILQRDQVTWVACLLGPFTHLGGLIALRIVGKAL